MGLFLSTALAVSAQPTVYIPAAADGATASSFIDGLCIGCSVTGTDDVVGRRQDAARLVVPVGVLSSAGIRVDLPASESANTRAGFVIDDPNGLLDVAVIDRVTVRTYLGATLQESRSGTSLLSLQLMASGLSKVTFRARKAYDAVEIEFDGAVALLTEIDVRYAIITRPTTLDRIVALESDGATASGSTSGLCLGCVVDDLSEAIDLPVATAANLRIPLGIAGSATLTVDYGTMLPAKAWTGFWVSSDADLLDLAVLGAIRIRALNGGAVVGEASGDDLRVTTRPDGLSFIRFRTNEAFDTVSIRISSLIGLSMNLNVHQTLTVPVETASDLDKAPLAAAPSSPARSVAEAGIQLGAPRPNPAAGLARVSLSTDAATQVRVAVYDALGREVAVLHDGTVDAGTRELTLDGTSLSPGTYVVRAASGAEAPQTRVLTIGR